MANRMDLDSIAKRPLWQILVGGLAITWVIAAAFGILAAAVLGDPWGGRVAQFFSIIGGGTIALAIMRRRGLRAEASKTEAPGPP